MHLQEGKYIQLLEAFVWHDRFGMLPYTIEEWLHHVLCSLGESVVAVDIVFGILMSSVLGRLDFLV